MEDNPHRPTLHPDSGSGLHDPVEAASTAVKQASEAARSQLDAAKRRATDGARQAADTAREAARNLRSTDQAWLAGLVERGADGLTDLAGTLRCPSITRSRGDGAPLTAFLYLDAAGHAASTHGEDTKAAVHDEGSGGSGRIMGSLVAGIGFEPMTFRL